MTIAYTCVSYDRDVNKARRLLGVSSQTCYVWLYSKDFFVYSSLAPLVDLAWIVSMLACEGDSSLACSIALCPRCKDEAGCHSIIYV